MPRVVIVMQFNDAYLRFGLTLLSSLERYAKNAIKVAYTVNLSDGDIAALKSVCPSLVVINSTVRFLRGRLLRNYMANRKVSVFKSAIARFARGGLETIISCLIRICYSGHQLKLC